MSNVRRLTDFTRKQDEYEVLRRSMGLNLSGFLPVIVMKINPRPTRRLKAKVAEIYSDKRSQLFHEAGYISEYALHRYLLASKIKHSPWKPGSQVSPDFRIWRYNEPITIGVRSRRHRDLMRFEDKPSIDYPIRRLRNPEGISDYIVAASNFTLGDGGSLVAFWGMIERNQLVEVMHQLLGNKPISTANDSVPIPLEEFKPEPLKWLLNLK